MPLRLMQSATRGSRLRQRLGRLLRREMPTWEEILSGSRTMRKEMLPGRPSLHGQSAQPEVLSR
jgi:hypothetical protein